jgi:hypothetical protein
MWRRRQKTESESDSVAEAREDAENATAEREQIEAQWPDIKKIGGSLQKAMERNHFGESIDRAWTRRE